LAGHNRLTLCYSARFFKAAMTLRPDRIVFEILQAAFRAFNLNQAGSRYPILSGEPEKNRLNNPLIKQDE
jgi:hypothetical protein